MFRPRALHNATADSTGILAPSLLSRGNFQPNAHPAPVHVIVSVECEGWGLRCGGWGRAEAASVWARAGVLNPQYTIQTPAEPGKARRARHCSEDVRHATRLPCYAQTPICVNRLTCIETENRYPRPYLFWIRSPKSSFSNLSCRRLIAERADAGLPNSALL